MQMSGWWDEIKSGSLVWIIKHSVVNKTSDFTGKLLKC